MPGINAVTEASPHTDEKCQAALAAIFDANSFTAAGTYQSTDLDAVIAQTKAALADLEAAGREVQRFSVEAVLTEDTPTAG